MKVLLLAILFPGKENYLGYKLVNFLVTQKDTHLHGSQPSRGEGACIMQ